MKKNKHIQYDWKSEAHHRTGRLARCWYSYLLWYSSWRVSAENDESLLANEGFKAQMQKRTYLKICRKIVAGNVNLFVNTSVVSRNSTSSFVFFSFFSFLPQPIAFQAYSILSIAMNKFRNWCFCHTWPLTDVSAGNKSSVKRCEMPSANDWLFMHFLIMPFLGIVDFFAILRWKNRKKEMLYFFNI